LRELAHLAQAKWVRERIPEDKIVTRLDSLYGMTEAVRMGLGVGLLLCLNGDREAELARLAEPEHELDTQVWVLTHPDLRNVARVKALMGFLYDELRRADFVRGERADRRPAPRSKRR